MGELKNEFSWSKSRDNVFRKCPRQYYFQYYGSWGGWDVQADKRIRKIYTLKQLKSRFAWAGAKVHDCIKTCLNNLRHGVKPMEEQEAIELTLDVMREDYANSKRGDYWKNPKTCGLFEHEYQKEVPNKAWKETADHVAHCLRIFYQSEVFQLIKGLEKEQWLEVEEFSHFFLDKTKVYVVLDFAFRDENGVIIYDWKTGKADTEQSQLQLACYSFYAIEKWKVKPKQVCTVEFNLANNETYPYGLKQADLEAIREYIRGSIRDMKLLLEDVEKNIATEENFDFVENERVCDFCSFKKVCPKWA